MCYLFVGLVEMGQGILGKVFVVLFFIFCIFVVFGGVNMFQVNQFYGVVLNVLLGLFSWVYGLVLVVLVGLVIIGGIQCIGMVVGIFVFLMCLFYVLVCLFIFLVNFI